MEVFVLFLFNLYNSKHVNSSIRSRHLLCFFYRIGPSQGFYWQRTKTQLCISTLTAIRIDDPGYRVIGDSEGKVVLK
jgi:hypothetical protein